MEVIFIKDLKGQGIKLYILSNSYDKKKVSNVAEKFDISYICFAKKNFNVFGT